MAISASAVILVAIYGVFTRAIHLRDTATTRVREARVVSRAVNIMRNDVRNALFSGGILAASLEGKAQGSGSSYPGYLKLTTTTAAVSEGTEELRGDVQQVEYFIIDDPAGGRSGGLLVRAVDRDLLAPIRGEAGEEPLLTDIASLEVSFYDGQSWQEGWEATPDNATLPEAIRLRVQPTQKPGEPAPAPIEIVTPWTTSAMMAPASDAGEAAGTPSSTGTPAAPSSTGTPTTAPGAGGTSPAAGSSTGATNRPAGGTTPR